MTDQDAERKAIAARYREYMLARQMKKMELEAKWEEELAEATRELDLEFSKFLHEAHDRGVNKTTLRVATKKHGNNDAFKRIWDLYQPEENTPEPEEVVRTAWDGKNLFVLVGDRKVTVVNPRYDAVDEAVVYDNFVDIAADPDYRLIHEAVESAVR